MDLCLITSSICSERSKTRKKDALALNWKHVIYLVGWFCPCQSTLTPTHSLQSATTIASAREIKTHMCTEIIRKYFLQV